MSRKPKKCSECKGLFLPYTSLDKFCSPDCAFKAISPKGKEKKPTIKKSPVYVDRVFDENKAEYREEMIDRCGYLYCEHCDRSGLRYEAHHLIFRSEKPNHAHIHSKRNIYLLCKTCHGMFHDKKGLRNNIVVQRNLSELFGIDILNKNT